MVNNGAPLSNGFASDARRLASVMRRGPKVELAFMALGGSVKGGKSYGKWDGLGRDRLYQGRDVPITTDFRDVIGNVLDRHLGLNETKLSQIFPNYKSQLMSIL